MAKLTLPGSLVQVDWLHQHLENKDLVIFDGSWHMPAARRNAYQEWQEAHIKNARFFDFDQRICDRNSELPHMFPDHEIFTREVQKLGLNRDSIVVIYDTLGIFTSPRVWWMLRAMGFDNCAILDGGLPAWQNSGNEVYTELQSTAPIPGNFVAAPVKHRVSSAQQVLDGLRNEAFSVVDARPSPRFSGEVEEPRAGLRKGHMPGATNLPFSGLLENGKLKPADELQILLADHFVTGKHAICSCGSGVTACVLAFAAHQIGFDDVSVYDGSWSEWGQPGDLPVTQSN